MKRYARTILDHAKSDDEFAHLLDTPMPKISYAIHDTIEAMDPDESEIIRAEDYDMLKMEEDNPYAALFLAEEYPIDMELYKESLLEMDRICGGMSEKGDGMYL